ncbi:MAG: hypothetical protein QGG17_02135 [Rhodospirillales bacterium]|jgi:hypothetical protein|nr:hypothetical protein [Rhodospirillales bacterium]MDP6803912.1 hypothetical protein [Rhodospirillales bacterium]
MAFHRIRATLAGLALVVGLVVGLAATADADEHPCRPVVEREIDRLGIGRADIRKIFILEKLGPSTSDGNVRRDGFDAWIQFRSCKGALIVDMGNGCRTRQVYTRGECRVPGLKNFC